MHRAIESTVLFMAFATSALTLSVCVNALIKRNREIGHASAVAPAGVKLILSTNDLTQPGYALSTGAAGIVAGAFLLLLLKLRVVPLFSFFRKILFLSPLLLLLNSLLSLASLIAVTYAARNGRLSVYATLGSTRLPTAAFDQQAAALGLSVYYWDKGYVKLMAIAPWFMLPFSFTATYIAYKYWQEERPSAHARRTVVTHGAAPMHDDKLETTHIA